MFFKSGLYLAALEDYIARHEQASADDENLQNFTNVVARGAYILATSSIVSDFNIYQF